MKAYDPQQAARVWQRVQGQKQEEKEKAPCSDGLPALIMAEWMAAATYGQLARQMPPKEAAVLRRMAQEEQSHALVLQGMYHLAAGERSAVKPQAVQREASDVMLRRSYAGELRSIAEYEARSADPEYGHVFTGMAQQEREHSRQVLEMIGGMGKKQQGQ